MQEPGLWSNMPYAQKYDLGYCFHSLTNSHFICLYLNFSELTHTHTHKGEKLC